MSLSLEERRQSVESSPSTSTSNTTKSDTPNQFTHQQTATSLNHRDTNEHQRSSSPRTNQSCQASNINSAPRLPHPQTDIMAMHNFGPNSSEHEHQLKDQQTNSGNDSSSWHNNNNNNNNNNNGSNNNNDGLSIMSNNEHINDPQHSSGVSNLSDHKLPVTENSKTQANRSTLNRHQQQHQSQLQSQSQQYHGIFSPQIPAILHSTLASRVDQIIRSTLHDSPAYTPPTSKNNSNSVLTNAASSNMPLPSSSSSHIFNATTGSTSTTSAQHSISSHLTNSGGVGSMSTVATTAPITSIYGSTLSSMSDTLNNSPNSNLVAKTSPSHSALAAAAALQSLNQSHVQRSQQQQMAHAQSSLYSNVSGSTSKPPSNGTGTPVPQAAHGGSIQMSKLNAASLANLDQHNLSFASDPSNVGSLNFSSRTQQNITGNGNNLSTKMTSQASGVGIPGMSWQEQAHANSIMSRLPPLHGLNGPLPSYAASSSQSLYGASSQLPGSLSSNNGNNMIGSDSDTMSKMNSMKNSSSQGNPMQFRDEKSFPMNFPTLLSNKQNQPDIENLRNPPSNSHEATLPCGVTNEKLVVFAYNLLSQGIPGKQQPKKVIHLDDDMRNAIQNGEFYSKYSHIASGIISNQMMVPNFSIIDYLRKDRFRMSEIETIERINGSLGIYDLVCLMELVKQRPWPSEKGGSDLSKASPYSDINSLNVGSLASNSQIDQSVLSSIHHNSNHQKSNSFLLSPPERSEILGLQGIDRSRRSSQSPSDISRSQTANNINSKFLSAHNPAHVHQGTTINPHQFTSPLCPPNSQQHHTSPQTNRSSPFQTTMSVGTPHPLARPPRSHSTLVGLGSGPFNAPFTPTLPQMRPPPAAHQNSSRPNLTGLDMHLMPAHANNTSVPVTAHMSSKLPQTPRLQDSMPRHNPKSGPSFGNNKAGGKESNHLEFQSGPGRFDLDPNHVVPIQNSGGLRQQELINRDPSMKQSTTPHYLQSNMLPPGMNQVDFVRHHEMTDGNAQTQINQLNMTNYGLNSRAPFDRNVPQGLTNSTMPPPLAGHMSSDIAGRTTGLGVSNDAKQYNALVAAYQQQMMMSRKIGDNSGGPINAMGQVPGYVVINQPGSQRPVGEPMHVDTLQQSRQPSSQLNSPKLNSQRSIITGSGSASLRKSKKSKPSPPAGTNLSDGKVATSEINEQSSSFGITASSSVTHETVSIPTKEDQSLNQAANDDANQQATNLDGPSLMNVKLEKSFTNSASADLTCNTLAVSDMSALASISARGLLNNTDVSSLKKVPESAPECMSISSTAKNVLDSTETKIESNLARLDVSSELSKPTIDTAVSQSVDQPSKYQKLFTKKAWLKNYDLEDQARSNGEQAPTDDNMPVSTRASNKPEQAPNNESDSKEDKLPPTVVKPVNTAKNGKTKADNKKKGKDSKSAVKSNVTNTLKSNNIPANKTTDNDSEETTASTSDLDDTDETDSLKSTNDKKLRRMPKRKVKLNLDREFSDSANITPKTKTPKDNPDKETTIRGRGKKEKVSDGLSNPTKRKHNSDDESIKQKAKKIKGGSKTDKSSLSPLSRAKKRAGEKFLQTQPCYEILPKSSRCLECRRVRQSNLKGDKSVHAKLASKTSWDDFCRFFEFRKLRYNKSAQLVIAGFSDAADAKESDLQLWSPSRTIETPKHISYKVAKFILANIGDEFCKLVLQERSALESYESKSGKKTTWKRAVYGLRELCDVCSTTLFNCHYVCDRCGFVVCLDCHESRARNQKTLADVDTIKEDQSEVNANSENNHTDVEQASVPNKKSKKDSHGWIFCAKNEEHLDDRLTLAKIIAGSCLEEVWTLLHEIRKRLNLGDCYCMQSKITGIQSMQVDSVAEAANDNEHESSHSTLKGLLLASSDSPMNGSVDTKPTTNLVRDPAKTKVSEFDMSLDNPELDFGSEDDSRQVSAAIEGCIASLALDGGCETQDELKTNLTEINFSLMNRTSSKLCNGDLLVLTHTVHKDNIRLFREHWRLGKPVLVRGVHNRMNMDMWLPQYFLGKFGEYRSDLVDCRNGDIHRQSMRKYWDGFEPSSTKKKSKEDAVPVHIPSANNEEPSAISTSYYTGSALWRLKDWPPGQDFCEILPDHYHDFMENLPLKPYTTRYGRLNLACRLPHEMVKPDLGPKMYSAYGTTKFPERGTTNLHLDISDAINVMIYVGGAMPFKQGTAEHGEIYDTTINECHVDPAMKEQIRQQKLIPGALWHIFKPADVGKIREFLNKVSDECKISHEKRIDPIHDQTWYLDQTLLDRLQREHGVKSYPILQCMGDAILIPAGAPHQVKNLQNCIKVANDFVSPENVGYCLKLTNEFRNLPETHINQEDKLQIKNILYHSVKESIQFIDLVESGKTAARDDSSNYDSSDDDDTKDGNNKTSQSKREFIQS